MEATNQSFSKRLKESLAFKHIGKYAPYILLLALVIFFGIVTDGSLFRPMNVSNVFINNSYLFFLSCALFFCILTGNTDLSLGSLIGFTSAVMGYTYVVWQWPILLSIFLCLVIGVVCGCLHGFVITRFSISPFMTTLAGNFVYRGLTEVILKGSSLGPLPSGLKNFAKGFVLKDLRIGNFNVVCLLLFALIVGIVVFSEHKRRKIDKQYDIVPPSMKVTILKNGLIVAFAGIIIFSFNQHKGVPIIVLVLGVVVAVYYFIANHTTFGRHVYAVGGDINAARLCGINVKRIMFLVYLNSALMAVISALVVCGRVNSAMTSAGDGYHMDAICACYIGGSAGSGGSGNLLSSMVGALLMAILINGMTLCGLGTSVQNICKGVVLVAAVAFDVYSRSKVSD